MRSPVEMVTKTGLRSPNWHGSSLGPLHDNSHICHAIERPRPLVPDHSLASRPQNRGSWGHWRCTRRYALEFWFGLRWSRKLERLRQQPRCACQVRDGQSVHAEQVVERRGNAGTRQEIRRHRHRVLKLESRYACFCMQSDQTLNVSPAGNIRTGLARHMTPLQQRLFGVSFAC